MNDYQVNEVFNTIQGEGLNSGQPATFIRLQGCSVGCVWCDTKYTWAKGGTRWAARPLVLSLDLKPLVVITGGEPTLYNLDDLITELRIVGQHRWGYNFKVQLETSGQNELKGNIVPDWITCSPKPNLGFTIPPMLARHIAELKWVIDDDITEANIKAGYDFVKNVQPQNRVYNILMPEGTPPSEDAIHRAMWMLELHPEWRFSDRLQWRLNVR